MPLGSLDPGADPQCRCGGIARQAGLVNHFEPVADIGIRRDRLLLGFSLGGSGRDQADKGGGEQEFGLMHIAIWPDIHLL